MYDIHDTPIRGLESYALSKRPLDFGRGTLENG